MAPSNELGLKTSDTLNVGYLFIDNHYISPPYRIELMSDERVSINDREYLASDYGYGQRPMGADGLQNVSFRNRPNRGFRRGGLNRPMSRSPSWKMFSDLMLDLRLKSLIILNTGQKPVSLDRHDASVLLSQISKDDSLDPKNPNGLGSEQFSAPAIKDLLNEYQPTSEFKERVNETLKLHLFAKQESEAASSALIWSSRMNYPLTMLAMVLVVAAFGHLLSSHPNVLVNLESSDGLSLHRKLVFTSLFFVIAFSMIDLVWTILASQSGSMRELNPLGSELIESPAALAFFKVALTSMSIGLIYWIHRQRLARVASWWCCLILTLLTARWLTFQSMFL